MGSSRFLGLFVLLVLLALVGCEGDFRDDPLPAPLAVREVVPAEDAVVPRDLPVGLSVTFTRAISGLDEIRLTLVPDADAGRPELSETGRTVTWLGVQPRESTILQQLLIDAPTMVRPYVHYWRTSAEVAALVTGFVSTPDPRVRSDAAVVFALHAGSGFNPLDLRTFVQAQPSGVGVGIERPDLSYTTVTVPLPAHGGEYYILAIVDTTGDLIYDPTEDWHGLYGDIHGALTVVPGVGAFEVELERP